MTHLEFNCADEKVTFLLKAERLYDEGLRDLPEWTPCSEKLPEEEGRYLCWYKNRMEVYSFTNNLHKVDNFDFFGRRYPAFYDYSSEWGYYEADWVEAWMPLPPAYKEGE